MDKSKFSDELKKKGYDAFVEGGVVMVRKSGKLEDTLKEIKDIAEKLDYKESIGVRVVVSAPSSTPRKKDADDINDINAGTEASSFEQMNLFDMISND